MSLDPPKVLLERSFLAALLDPDSAHHGAAAQCYAELVDRFEEDEIMLVALDVHLRELRATLDPDRRLRLSLLAPVNTMHVAGQHRLAARQADAEPDVAITLVMMRWNHLARLATFDGRFDDYDIEIIPDVPTLGEPADAEEPAAL